MVVDQNGINPEPGSEPEYQVVSHSQTPIRP